MPPPEILKERIGYFALFGNEFGIEGGTALKSVFLKDAPTKAVDGEDGSLIEIPEGGRQPPSG
ncbi:MAG: hypothetical protein A4E66_01684 [Syntrophus sp. PtaB.Bin001]|nr:MAG: hypothetical protein A4E66_01684 [Syntrophus sp. PtaB.Bin001]